VKRAELEPDMADRIRVARRKAVRLSGGDLVRAEQLRPGLSLPLLIKPVVNGLSLIDWAAGSRALIEAQLLRHGGILFRGFGVKGLKEFEQFIRTTSDGGGPIEYAYPSTPRTRVQGNIYTSTEYPPDQSIPLHNEMSYATSWPLKIYFLCLQPAERGGETPLADSRQVFARLPRDIRERFMRKKVLYQRNYGGGLDLPWQKVFQSADRSQVEEYCRREFIHAEWDGDRLRTGQSGEAARLHPQTGEPVWFNQAHLFHVSSFAPEIRESLLTTFAEGDLPRNAYYSDGTPLEGAALDEIRAAYRREEVAFAWAKGDVLMLDNMLAAHARRPFAGERRIVVGMAELYQVQPLDAASTGVTSWSKRS
jgi:alpha-ketoglutarate-dependent taurine dioxygenase